MIRHLPWQCQHSDEFRAKRHYRSTRQLMHKDTMLWDGQNVVLFIRLCSHDCYMWQTSITCRYLLWRGNCTCTNIGHLSVYHRQKSKASTMFNYEADNCWRFPTTRSYLTHRYLMCVDNHVPRPNTRVVGMRTSEPDEHLAAIHQRLSHKVVLETAWQSFASLFAQLNGTK